MSGSPLQKLFKSFLVLILTGQAIAQPVKTSSPDLDSLLGYTQMKNGLDQELINGIQYYNPYVQYKGDPFFPENVFYEGSLNYKGIQYDQLRLKYDCYAQELILEYKDFNGRYNHLLLDSMFIDSFGLEGHRFQKLSLFGDKPVYYQVVNSGPITCYVYWKANLTSVSYDFQYTHEFSEPAGKFFIAYKGQVKSLRNKKSYRSLFSESMQGEIKKYMRRQRFSFRVADPTDIQELLSFTSKLEARLSTP